MSGGREPGRSQIPHRLSVTARLAPHHRARRRRIARVRIGGGLPDGSIEGNDNDVDPTAFEPHYQAIVSPNQVQIYEAILRDSEGAVTTSARPGRRLPQGQPAAAWWVPKERAVRGHRRARCRRATTTNFLGGGDRVLLDVPLSGTAAPALHRDGRTPVTSRSATGGWRTYARPTGAEVATFLGYATAVPNEPIVMARHRGHRSGGRARPKAGIVPGSHPATASSRKDTRSPSRKDTPFGPEAPVRRGETAGSCSETLGPFGPARRPGRCERPLVYARSLANRLARLGVILIGYIANGGFPRSHRSLKPAWQSCQDVKGRVGQVAPALGIHVGGIVCLDDWRHGLARRI